MNPHLPNTSNLYIIIGIKFYGIYLISEFIHEQVDLAYDDLKNHHSEWVEPVLITISVMMLGLPPNGQGIAALQILNLLELSI